MAIFVNYYPCSYGDSIVSMFQGLNKVRNNDYIFLNSKKRIWFKLPDFYNANSEQQTSLLSNLGSNVVVSCHRQHQFDFGKNHTVISIVLDDLSWISKRFCDVNIKKLGKSLSNLRLLQLQSKIPMEDLVLYDYKHWAKHNIFDTDIKLFISMLYDSQRLKDFCNLHNLQYSQCDVDNIIKSIGQYK